MEQLPGAVQLLALSGMLGLFILIGFAIKFYISAAYPEQSFLSEKDKKNRIKVKECKA